MLLVLYYIVKELFCKQAYHINNETVKYIL